MAWELRYAPAATAGIRKIPRGTAAYVTAAIRALAQNPLPTDREAIEELPHTYRISEWGHIVEYQLLHKEQIVKILYIE